MNSLNLSEQDNLFCEKARYRNEIANYLGISTRTLRTWLIQISLSNTNIQNRRLFTPKEVKEIIKECK